MAKPKLGGIYLYQSSHHTPIFNGLVITGPSLALSLALYTAVSLEKSTCMNE